MVVDHDAAALADRELRGARELVVRPDAGGIDDDVGLERGAVGEHHPVRALAAPSTISLRALRRCARCTPSASIFLRSTRPPASSSCTAIRRGANSTTCVSSPRSVSAFAASRPSRPPPMTVPTRARLRCRADHFEVLDRAVDEAAAAVAARDRRHEGIRAGRQHELVVGHLAVARGAHDLALAVDRHDAVVETQRDRLVFEEPLRHHAQIDGRLAGEEAGELHAIVGRARLLAEHGEIDLVARHAPGQLLEEALSDHAVAHTNNSCLCHEFIDDSRASSGSYLRNMYAICVRGEVREERGEGTRIHAQAQCERANSCTEYKRFRAFALATPILPTRGARRTVGGWQASEMRRLGARPKAP